MSKPAEAFTQFVLEQLDSLPELVCRRMFGGYGLYSRGTFFGIVYNGQLFFKTNDVTRKRYIACGMQPFRPNAKQTLKNYHQLPVQVLEDAETLNQWALESIAVATD